ALAATRARACRGSATAAGDRGAAAIRPIHRFDCVARPAHRPRLPDRARAGNAQGGDMTMHAVLRQWQARLRRRAIVDLLRWLPLILVATVFLISRSASAAVLAASVAVACSILL